MGRESIMNNRKISSVFFVILTFCFSFANAEFNYTFNEIFFNEKSLTVFNDILEETIKTLGTQMLSDDSRWINGAPPQIGENISFAASVMFPENPEINIIGDTHGIGEAVRDIFMDLLIEGKISYNFVLKKNNIFLALGDYVNRGTDGVEVLSVLFSILIQNPKQAFLIRGNHETKEMIILYGLYKEILQKGKKQNFTSDKLQQIWFNLLRVFRLLPHAVVAGIDKTFNINKEQVFIYFTHAGPLGKSSNTYEKQETIVDLKPLLSKVVQNEKTCEPFFYRLDELPVSSWSNWADIVAKLSRKFKNIAAVSKGVYQSKRGIYGRVVDYPFVRRYLEFQNQAGSFYVKTFICGHTHTGGVVRLRKRVYPKDLSLEIETEPAEDIIREATKKSWSHLTINRRRKIRDYDIFSCTSAALSDKYRKPSYAILTAD
jgi:hypothetical protein